MEWMRKIALTASVFSLGFCWALALSDALYLKVQKLFWYVAFAGAQIFLSYF